MTHDYFVRDGVLRIINAIGSSSDDVFFSGEIIAGAPTLGIRRLCLCRTDKS